MEPISESEKKEILENNPRATPELIEEYEGLLVAEFLHDPSQHIDKNQSEFRIKEEQREKRIEELYNLLFLKNS